jgi:hypothetical protein
MTLKPDESIKEQTPNTAALLLAVRRGLVKQEDLTVLKAERERGLNIQEWRLWYYSHTTAPCGFDSFAANKSTLAGSCDSAISLKFWPSGMG